MIPGGNLARIARDHGQLHAVAAGHILPLGLLGRQPDEALGVGLRTRRRHEHGKAKGKPACYGKYASPHDHLLGVCP
jgi:hypothetical protein